MASVARAIEQAASCAVDESLWWDSHERLFHDLDDFVSESRKVPHDNLVQKLQANHLWLLNMLLQFKEPSPKSQSALDVGTVVLGDHTLEINAEMKSIALELSKKLVLDEVQAYILVNRFCSNNAVSLKSGLLQKQITMNYFMERQCLLKCTRLILLSHLAEAMDKTRVEMMEVTARKLAKDGLENKEYAILSRLLKVDRPLQLDLDISHLWAEEIITEVNLVMDILFLIYYEPLCPCSFNRWNELFFMFQDQIFNGKSLERLSLTAEALGLAKHVKHQALLILFETLDFDKLLLLVFNEVSFSHDNHPFSMEELQQMDGLFANFKAFDVPEAAPLLLGWGTFCSLVSSLPVLDNQTKVLEIEYTTHIQRAYEAGAFQYLLDMLHHKGMQESSIDGYRGVVKSLLTCFITAFDIVNHQTDSTLLDTLVDIFYAIYSEQEILCVEFWDRDNALDSPVRNLLFALREYFPYRLRPFLRLLAGLAKGTWPAECVFGFLYKMSDVASPYLLCMTGSPIEDGQSIVTTLPLEVPGASGLIIPAGTNGHIVKVMDKQTVIARWKCKYNALAILLACLMDSSCLSNSWPEVETIVILLHQMLSSNKLLANSLLGLDDLSLPAHTDAYMDEYARINVLAVICVLLDKLMDGGMDMSAAALSVEILSAFTCCCPAKVMFELSKLTVAGPQWSTQKHLGEGLLVKLLAEVSRDVQQSEQRQKLICSVVELSIELVEKGVQSEALNNIVVHIVGTCFVNHLSWRYAEKFECWRMTAKIFQLACRVLYVAEPKTAHLRSRVLEIMVVDGSFHDVILKILSVSAHDLEDLCNNHYASPKEIEWFQKALTYGTTLLHLVLLNLPGWLHFRDGGVMTPIEHAVLHHAVGTMSFIGCIASLVGFFRNPDIQLAAVRLFMVLCVVAAQVKPHSISISSYLQDADQRRLLRLAIGRLYSEESSCSNGQLFDATIDLSKSAAKCQPSLIELLFSPINSEVLRTYNSNTKDAVQSLPHTEKQQAGEKENNHGPLDSIREMMKQGVSLFESQPHTVCGILSLLASLWEGGAEYHGILEDMRNHDGFWNILTGYVSRSITQKPNDDEQILVAAFKFQCQTAALKIMAYETFLRQFKLVKEGTNQMYSQARKCFLYNTDSKLTSELPLAHWCKVIHPSRIISSFVTPLYDSKGILKAKAEMRALFVALLLKIFMGDDVGLSNTLVEYLQQALNDVLNHSSFQEILSTYLYHGYGSGKDLQALILNDLYFHLQGELEAGRQIPGGCFKNLVDFVGSFSLIPLLHQRKKTKVQELPIEHIDHYIYDTTSLRQHLGLEWCPLPTSIVYIAAESTLDALQHANGISCLTFAQISALESLHNLLSISDDKKQPDGELASLKGMWAGSCIQELCMALDISVQLLTPDQDSAEYILKFIAAQSRLLLLLVEWFCSCGADNQPNIHTEETSAKVIRTVIQSLQSILGSLSTIILAPKLLIGSLLGAYLLCLEVMQLDNHRLRLSEHKSNLNQWSNEDSLINMEFLPVLCSFVEIKAYAKLATAAMTLLIRHFLSPQAWLPVLQTHFRIEFSLSLLRMTEDMDTSYQLLSFFLSLLHVKGGVKILDVASLLSHILLFSEQLKEELLMEGPFHVSRKRAKRNELWSLCVAIIAASARTVCHNDGPTIENAFIFFESQKEQLLQTLQSPSFSFDMEGNKRAKLLHPQTSIIALQRTQQVLHLLIELRRHNAQWFHVVGKTEMDFCQKCIHLLAYIAREGLLRNVNNVIGNQLLCPPTTSEEINSHNMPSSIRCFCGWFAITARGASFLRNTTPNTSSQKPNQLLPPCMASDRTEIDHMTATKYSDAVASDVYKVALLMLEFLCKQAQHTVKSLCEGGLSSLHILPEFAAPEILYGLQDQAMSIISEVCSQGLNRPIEEEAKQICCVLFSIMEKTVFLEVCVARMCGIFPSSMRSEDFIKEFKNFLSAIKGHQFLDRPSKALKSILGLAYPTLT